MTTQAPDHIQAATLPTRTAITTVILQEEVANGKKQEGKGSQHVVTVDIEAKHASFTHKR